METSRRKGWRKKGVKGLIKVTLTSVAPALIPLIRGFHPRCIICGVASILPWIDTWCESEKVFEGRGWRARSFSSYAVAWMLNGSCDLSVGVSTKRTRHLGCESCAFGKITGLVLTDDEISMRYLWRITNECHRFDESSVNYSIRFLFHLFFPFFHRRLEVSNVFFFLMEIGRYFFKKDRFLN